MDWGGGDPPRWHKFSCLCQIMAEKINTIAEKINTIAEKYYCWMTLG